MMSCIIAQKQHPANVPLDQAADGSSVLETAVGSKSASARHGEIILQASMEKHEKALVSKQACDASGNLYHRFYFHGL